MKVRKRFFFLILFFLVFLFHGRILGLAVEPFLERKLTTLFDMPISIQGLRVHFWPCQVHMDYFMIHNPPDFRAPNHFVAKDIDLTLDTSLFKNKFIRITLAHFKEVLFAVESYTTAKGPVRTNVKIWYHNMGLDQDSPVPPGPPHPKPPPDNAGEPNWRVRIDRLELENGSILIHDRRDSKDERRWLFKSLKGFWTGFDFVSDYFSPTFNEFIRVEGTFGENPPAVFRGAGKCQFADGDNFDVVTEILRGSVLEYDFLLEGLPGEVHQGTFDLFSKMKCVESNLDSDHVLKLNSLKITNPTAAQMIFKYPFDGVLLLLEKNKTVELEVKVKGDIEDPKFGVLAAFTKAFQKSLFEKAMLPIKGLSKGGMLLATETPKQMQNGFGKLSSMLADPLTATLKTFGGSSNEENQDVKN